MFAKLHVEDFSTSGLGSSFSYTSRIEQFKQRNKEIFVTVEDYLLRGGEYSQCIADRKFPFPAY